MPFSKDNPPPSRTGIRNKLTGAQQDFLKGWNRAGGPETAYQLMKKAVAMAKEGNFGPLKDLLPYIARRMPETIELPEGSIVNFSLRMGGEKE